MTTIFKLACQSCGLTMSEATAFLGVREGTAKDWWLGRRTPKPSVLADLLDLAQHQERAAAETVNVIQHQAKQHGQPEEIELGISADDHEAQSLGWPCVGAHAAVLRRIIESLDPDISAIAKIVPQRPKRISKNTH